MAGKKIDNLKELVVLGKKEQLITKLQKLKKKGKEIKKYLIKTEYENGETILHIAVKYKQNNIIEYLVETCPELLLQNRSGTEYEGQTAIHVAISKGNIQAVEFMLSIATSQIGNKYYELVHTHASGCKFVNTVMMGELPLSVAALTFKTDMIDLLLAKGAEMERQNSKGDTVFHSLIKYAAIYPEKHQNVLNTLAYLQGKITENNKQSSNDKIMDYESSNKCFIWFICNEDGLNPLQLSASLAQPEFFNYILKLPNVYCYLNEHDGLFDMVSYDITEIDTIATELWSSDQRKGKWQKHHKPQIAEGLSSHKFENKEQTVCSPITMLQREKQQSILETMFDIKGHSAFEFLQQPVMRQVIKTKWQKYSQYYYIWMVLHLVFMTTLTVFASYRSNDYREKSNSSFAMSDDATSTEPQEFISGFKWICLFVGLFYFLYVCVCLYMYVCMYSCCSIHFMYKLVGREPDTLLLPPRGNFEDPYFFLFPCLS